LRLIFATLDCFFSLYCLVSAIHPLHQPYPETFNLTAKINATKALVADMKQELQDVVQAKLGHPVDLNGPLNGPFPEPMEDGSMGASLKVQPDVSAEQASSSTSTQSDKSGDVKAEEAPPAEGEVPPPTEEQA
jgi:hypothetical protein